MNKNIACLTTGGTIISTGSDKGLVISDDVAGFSNKLNDIIGDGINVDFIDLYNIDSSDVNIDSFESIASKINEIKDKYDGYVIVHGTDTMAYTASVLSYMIKGLKKPVILTGSMIPMEEEGTDAVNNIVNSFKASINSTLFGVYVAFGNKLIMGNKVVKLNTTSFTTFDSPNFSLVGKFINNELYIDSDISNDINFENNKTSENIDIDINIEGNVGILKLYPGIDYEIFDYFILKKVKGLVIEGYGDGNVPSDDRFKLKVKKCLDNGINIILKSQCIYGKSESEYAGGRALIEMGCINGYNLTTEAARAKLMRVLEKYKGDKDTINKILISNINCDLTIL